MLEFTEATESAILLLIPINDYSSTCSQSTATFELQVGAKEDASSVDNLRPIHTYTHLHVDTHMRISNRLSSIPSHTSIAAASRRIAFRHHRRAGLLECPEQCPGSGHP